MCDAELIEVMQVGEAKDEGRQEDGAGEAGAGPEQQRDGRGAEQTFLGDGTL